MQKLELLSPGGSYDKIKYALRYGADAVYTGLPGFSLRAAAGNLSREELYEAVELAHSMDKKLFVTTNIVAKNSDLKNFGDCIKTVIDCKADAVIVTDLGLFSALREMAPSLEVHVSTQANVLNYESCNFFYKQGAKRIVLARELSLDEIREIRSRTPRDLELEVFVHGAMCISYSGRCLLSDYMTGRPSNRGECAQSCRWNYALMEEKRPGECFPIYEDEKGSFIFNSKDLCLIEHLDKLADAGVTSFKIEGRVKTEYYVATVTKAYAGALKDLKDGKPFNKKHLEECLKVSHREYYTGFLFGEGGGQIYGNNSYIRDCELIGTAERYDGENRRLYFSLKNPFSMGDILEILSPDKDFFVTVATDIRNEAGELVERANHPQEIYSVNCDIPAEEMSLVRKATT